MFVPGKGLPAVGTEDHLAGLPMLVGGKERYMGRGEVIRETGKPSLSDEARSTVAQVQRRDIQTKRKQGVIRSGWSRGCLPEQVDTQTNNTRKPRLSCTEVDPFCSMTFAFYSALRTSDGEY